MFFRQISGAASHLIILQFYWTEFYSKESLIQVEYDQLEREQLILSFGFGKEFLVVELFFCNSDTVFLIDLQVELVIPTIIYSKFSGDGDIGLND